MQSRFTLHRLAKAATVVALTVSCFYVASGWLPPATARVQSNDASAETLTSSIAAFVWSITDRQTLRVCTSLGPEAATGFAYTYAIRNQAGELVLEKTTRVLSGEVRCAAFSYLELIGAGVGPDSTGATEPFRLDIASLAIGVTGSATVEAALRQTVGVVQSLNITTGMVESNLNFPPGQFAAGGPAHAPGKSPVGN